MDPEELPSLDDLPDLSGESGAERSVDSLADLPDLGETPDVEDIEIGQTSAGEDFSASLVNGLTLNHAGEIGEGVDALMQLADPVNPLAPDHEVGGMEPTYAGRRGEDWEDWYRQRERGLAGGAGKLLGNVATGATVGALTGGMGGLATQAGIAAGTGAVADYGDTHDLESAAKSGGVSGVLGGLFYGGGKLLGSRAPQAEQVLGLGDDIGTAMPTAARTGSARVPGAAAQPPMPTTVGVEQAYDDTADVLMSLADDPGMLAATAGRTGSARAPAVRSPRGAADPLALDVPQATRMAQQQVAPGNDAWGALTGGARPPQGAVAPLEVSDWAMSAGPLRAGPPAAPMGAREAMRGATSVWDAMGKYATGRGISPGAASGVAGAFGGASAAGQAATLNWAVQSVLASGQSGLDPQDDQRMTEAVLSGDDKRVAAAVYQLQQKSPAFQRNVQAQLESVNGENL